MVARSVGCRHWIKYHLILIIISFRKTNPPGLPYNITCENRKCEGKDLFGPYGWCHVELYEVLLYKIIFKWKFYFYIQDYGLHKPDSEPFGFCSSTCSVKELTPSLHHKTAEVDILSSARCKKYVWNLDLKQSSLLTQATPGYVSSSRSSLHSRIWAVCWSSKLLKIGSNKVKDQTTVEKRCGEGAD